MKKFRVNLYFHGRYGVDVQADDEYVARQIAEERMLKMNDREFISAIDLMPDGHDVYEL